MSSELNDHSTVSTRIKEIAISAALFPLGMGALSMIAAIALNDWPDNSLTGRACLALCLYAYLRIAEEFIDDSILRFVSSKARIFIAVAATSLAYVAIIEFALQGPPAMTSPMQNEWRALLVAISIIAFGANVIVPPALSWVITKIIKIF